MPQLLIYLLIDILIFAVIAYALYWVCTHFLPNLPPCTVDLRRRAADRSPACLSAASWGQVPTGPAARASNTSCSAF